MSAEKESLRRTLVDSPMFGAPPARADADGHICRTLEQMPEISRAGCIALYSSVGHEPDISALGIRLIEKGVARLCFPRRVQGPVAACKYEMAAVADPSQLRKGCFGIPEPVESCPSVSPDGVDTWIVPGVAFDLEGYRLGRGRGVYDRLLGSARGIRIGVSYSARVLPGIPHDGHDARMDMIVTEKGMVFSLIESGTSMPGQHIPACDHIQTN